MRDRNANRSSAATATSASYARSRPCDFQCSRQDCSSQSPPMFFNSRVVPQTPPSLVKLSASALEVMTGSRNSVPSSDQVPELRNATFPDAETDATADAVSWQAGATTGVPAQAADTLACRVPIIVPGCTSGCSRRVGNPISSSILVAHVRVRASMNCVVVATVYSDVNSPVSQ